MSSTSSAPARCSATRRCSRSCRSASPPRAAEPTTLLQIPEPALRPVLERPDALRYVARTLAEQPALLTGPDRAGAADPAERPVREPIRAAPVVCEPSTTVQEAARRMAEAGLPSVVVPADGALGIVTDRDLRTRVLAAGAAGSTPLSEVMSAPARTVAADRSGTEAMMEMLDRGVRHLPGSTRTGGCSASSTTST